MSLYGPPQNQGVPKDTATFQRIRNAIILPDGSSREPLGSGVITGILGVGGMANVYEIWNSQLELSRAVKLLHPNYTEEARQRFETEIKITAKLNHPNIVEIHAVGNWNGLPYIEMERIYGQTLETIIADRGALPTEVSTAIGIMICRALRFAHHQDYVIYGKTYHGVIHRDLKPSNIMISTQGVMKLMDFGIARPTDASIHTTDGSILGTMQYLSPEQLDGKDADIRSDIYSVGTILYEMITGIKAFPESNASRLMLSKIKNEFKSLDKYNLKIPSRLRYLIHKCLVYDREKRVQGATALLSELTKIHKSITTLTPEQVVKQFLTEPVAHKKIISPRNTIPFVAITIAALSTGIIAFLFNMYFSTSFLKDKRARQIGTIDSNQKSSETITQKQVEMLLGTSNEVALEGKLRTQKKERVSPKIVKPLSISTTQPSAPVAELSLFEKLSNLYGISDTLSLFVKTVQSKRFQDAYELFVHLSPKDASSDIAIVHQLRMLNALGKKNEVNQALMNYDIKDGEFYLEKARMFIRLQNVTEALPLLELCSKTKGAYIDNGSLHLEFIYSKARCMSLLFDKSPDSASKNNALDSWFEVKSELQTMPQHRYFKEADEEMQRITQKMNTDKG